MSTLIRAFRSTHLRTPTHARIRTSVIAPGTSIRRAFVSSAQARAAAAVLSAPTQEAIDAEEIDVQLTPPHEARIELTDRAAEQLRTIAAREQNQDAALRIAVESGGCHGYQYKMELATARRPDDYHFTHPTLTPANLLIDAVSLGLLNGATVDFATELIGSSFRITENPNAKGGGCGCGVSWELKG